MSETLYIRLGSKANNTIYWLIFCTAENEIIASGELANAAQLTELTEKSQKRQVIVFVPACDIVFKSLTIPSKSVQATRLAAPYMLEEDLAQDVDKLFFAYNSNVKPREVLSVNNEQDTQQAAPNCFLAAVESNLMESWLTWLQEANIYTKVMIPDVLAMPLFEGQYSAIALGEQIIVRQGQWQGFSMDANAWQVVSKKWQQEQSASVNTSNAPANTPRNISETAAATNETAKVSATSTNSTFPIINNYSLLPQAPEGLVLNPMPEELPLALLAQHCRVPFFNLLQGQFKVKESRSPLLKTWLWAASFALLALLMNLGLKGANLLQLNTQQEQLESAIIQTYQATFPNASNVNIATIRSLIKSKLAQQGSSASASGFLDMLNKILPGFTQVPELKPETLKFDGKRQEIRIVALADNYQTFEKFKNILESNQLSVSQGAQSNQGDKISGSFSITHADNDQESQ